MKGGHKSWHIRDAALVQIRVCGKLFTMSLNGEFVCPECFEDEAIRAFVREHLVGDECSYCGKAADDGTEMAASIEDVIEFIRNKLAVEFEDPVEQVSWNSAEGGYVGVCVYDTGELFDALGGYPCSNQDLIEDIVDGIGDQAWCERDPYMLSPGQGLSSGWCEFCRLVKHHTRFMFFPAVDHDDAYDPEAIAPQQMLARIGALIQSTALVRTIKSGTRFYRARTHATGIILTTAEELGPPPENRSVTNRMNPAGIPMFYGATDRDTAIEEVKSGDSAASIGQFELLHDIVVVDLSKLRPIPGFFDEGTRSEKASIAFLHQFVKDATLPITRDGNEHIDYVPTQIVTEYFRHRFLYEYEPGRKSQVYGVLYPSSKRAGGLNVVLFFDRSSFEGIDDDGVFKRKKWLRLVEWETTELG